MLYLPLLLALAVLTLGAELLVRGASLLALRLGLSPLFVGLTVVGIGTSTPELAASLFATAQGSSGVGLGNAVGSNIFNVGVILGVTALIHPIRIQLRVIRRDLLVALLAACLPFVALAFGGELTTAVGAGFLVLLAAYLVTAFRAGRRAGAEQEQCAAAELNSTLAITAEPRLLDAVWVNACFLALGLVCLVLGSRWFVGSAVSVATAWGLSERIIGLTVVSVGTSLPELVTSVVAARRRNPDIAVGNVIGSNIFNVLGVLGACAVLEPQHVPASVLRLDMPVMVLATLALLPIVRSGGVISRLEGGLLLGGYAVYLGWLLTGGG